MFLNWVYRRYSGGFDGNSCDDPAPIGMGWIGFLNASWKDMVSESTQPGSNDDSRPGSKRFELMISIVSAVLAEHGW